jgi:hypothetical protein
MKWLGLNKALHLDKAVSFKQQYQFAKKNVLVPVCMFELQPAAALLPLVFVESGESYRLCSVLGLESQTNLFVNEDGSWSIPFIPSALKLYPFKAVTNENGDRSLIYDEDSGYVVDRNQGEPLFNKDGSFTEILKKNIQLQIKVETSLASSGKACSLLAELELLTPLEFKFQRSDGVHVKVEGLSTIDVNKFREVEEKKFIELRKTFALELVYAHIYSQSNFNLLINRMKVKKSSEDNMKKLGLDIFSGEEKDIEFNFT